MGRFEFQNSLSLFRYLGYYVFVLSSLFEEHSL